MGRRRSGTFAASREIALWCTYQPNATFCGLRNFAMVLSTARLPATLPRILITADALIQKGECQGDSYRSRQMAMTRRPASYGPPCRYQTETPSITLCREYCGPIRQFQTLEMN